MQPANPIVTAWMRLLRCRCLKVIARRAPLVRAAACPPPLEDVARRAPLVRAAAVAAAPQRDAEQHLSARNSLEDVARRAPLVYAAAVAAAP
eukprot:90922-Chlamydomonas_euryale.AAC.2